MTLTSTGMSVLTSSYFSDWGLDHKGHYTHYHTQRLLYALAAILIVLQLWFWLVYLPLRRCHTPARLPAIQDTGALRPGEERRDFGVEPLTALSSRCRSEAGAVAPAWGDNQRTVAPGPAWGPSSTSAVAAAPVRVQ